MAAWTDLGGGIQVRQSARYAMNSVLALDPEHALVIDPGILPSELDEIRDVVAAAGPRQITLVFTHAHWDHVLGKPWWPGAETIGHDLLGKELRRDAAGIVEEADRLERETGERWPHRFAPFAPDHAVSGLHFRKIGPWRCVFRSAPGHCDSQIDVHLPEARVLVAADMLSDIEIPALNQAPDVYRHSLDALLPIAHGGAIEALIPGHGSIAHGRDEVLARIAADLEYLEVIDHAARDAVARGRPAEDAIERLEAMEYAGKRSAEYPTAPIHAENIRLAHGALVAARGQRPGGRAGP
jgi:glyoxylase-like metal-dependent hydrolase (beta-lactamase superfamily II)